MHKDATEYAKMDTQWGTEDKWGSGSRRKEEADKRREEPHISPMACAGICKCSAQAVSL